MKKADIMEASEIARAMCNNTIKSDELFVNANAVERLSKYVVITTFALGMMLAPKLECVEEAIRNYIKRKKKEEE